MNRFIKKVEKINLRVQLRINKEDKIEKGSDSESQNRAGSIFSIEEKQSEGAPDYLIRPFTLIITDCNMPVMDGLEMGFEIKKYYDEFIKNFVKIKNSQICGVHK
jgi:CheY-like chemotaxis protein